VTALAWCVGCHYGREASETGPCPYCSCTQFARPRTLDEHRGTASRRFTSRAFYDHQRHDAWRHERDAMFLQARYPHDAKRERETAAWKRAEIAAPIDAWWSAWNAHCADVRKRLAAHFANRAAALDAQAARFAA
jgi:hypothetical protein